MIDGRGKCHSVNQHCDARGTRIVVVHSRRSAQDFPLPGGLVGLIRRSVTQDYLIIANTAGARTPNLPEIGSVTDKQESSTPPASRHEENGVMVGEVVVLPPDDDPVTGGVLKGLLEQIHDDMDRRQQAGIEANLDALAGLPQHIRDQLDASSRQIACFRLKFALFRTGEVRIWFDWSDFLGRDADEFPPTDMEQVAAEALPSQAYYFLKDVFHYHYHHDPRTDQLLDITRVDTSLVAPAGDSDWRVNILRGLAKVVVEYRQSNRPDSHKKALGVLAYADAFQSVLARTCRCAQVEQGFVWNDDVILYDFEHTRTSIEALDAISESERGAHLQLFGIFIGVLLSALALWAGAVQIQPILCGDDRANAAVCPPIRPNFTTNLVNWIVANPLGFVVLLTLAGGMAYIFLFKRVTNVPFAKPVLRFVRSMSEAVGTEVAKRGRDRIGYYAQLVLLFGLSVLLAWGAYWVTPKNEVPPVTPRPSAAPGTPWASLDQFVGKSPKETGLFTTSVIAGKVRDILGEDYDAFLVRMTQQSELRRDGNILWVVGSRSTGDQDGAYLLIDQNAQQLEIGVRTNGQTDIYRSTGVPVRKPGEMLKAIGGFAGDVGPFPLETSSCKSSSRGATGPAIHLSGALRDAETCTYKLDLRKGQVVGYSATSARGLDVMLVDGEKVEAIGKGKAISRDGTYEIRVSWQLAGGKPDETRPRREFYVRMNVR
ncbi:hypothetical protein [uncultured Phenylobacterium sp.]|uniref:hypothetical protein n=1 Tax=uncultured Phenylobacterium sp. TaxID=349273 RepID=UPI0025E66B67|nr:hypothetical protein [uncultured Phenylobacterium sp.]